MRFLAHIRRRLYKKRMIATAAALLLILSFGGCGATPMIELTAEEEDIITLYSAKVVAKHNVRLAQGLMRYKGAQEDAADSVSDTAENTDAEDAFFDDFDGDDVQGGSSAAVAPGQTASLNEIFGTAGLNFSYDHAAFENDFIFNNYYHLTPSSGNDYLIMYFTVSNTTDAAVDVDLYSYDPVFTATVDGNGYTSETTILPNDLATYLTTIGAGDSDTAILLFDVPSSGSKDVDAVGLQVKVGNTTYGVSL